MRQALRLRRALLTTLAAAVTICCKKESAPAPAPTRPPRETEELVSRCSGELAYADLTQVKPYKVHSDGTPSGMALFSRDAPLRTKFLRDSDESIAHLLVGQFAPLDAELTVCVDVKEAKADPLTCKYYGADPLTIVAHRYQVKVLETSTGKVLATSRSKRTRASSRARKRPRARARGA